MMHRFRRLFTFGLLPFFLIMLLAGCGTVTIPRASYLLTGNTHQRCLQVLREGLQSDEFWPSIHAAEALIDADYGFEATPILLQRRERETDRRRIAGYARALLKTDNTQALLDLQDILLSDDTEARILAAEALFRNARIGNPTILAEATDSLNSSRLRVFAAATLTITHQANMLDIIREALQSNDPAARYIAADVLPMVGSAEKDRAMLLDRRDLAHSDFENLYFIRALAIFGVGDAYAELLDFLDHPDPTIRSRAAFAMAETWNVSEGKRLVDLLEDPALAVRVRAAQALFTLSNPTSPYRFLGEN